MSLFGLPETVSEPGTPDSSDRKSLWRDPDFLKIWTAQSTSNLGQLMSVLPLVAILVLGARPYQMAIIGGASVAAGLSFGLIAGPWIDRTKRRLVLVATDLGQALSIASIAIAGVVAELAGLRVALAIGSVIWLMAGMVLLHPAIRNLRDMPEEVAEAGRPA